jgi:dienelactone hydrolase
LSYRGFRFLASRLASNGYAVVSLQIPMPDVVDDGPDSGVGARSQFVEAALEQLRRWSTEGGDQGGDGEEFRGRLDFTRGIGLIGHSRGGDAVTDAVARLPRETTFSVAATLAIAPSAFTRQPVPSGTNYGVILPSCDGDLAELPGARFFENAKYAAGGDAFAKVQWYVQGANHNFFNQVWTWDDYRADDAACSLSQPTNSRLTADDQQRVGNTLASAFMRRYVGGETVFNPIMTGRVTLPTSAAPQTSRIDAREIVKTSYIGPAASRFDLLGPRPFATDDEARRAASETLPGGELKAAKLTVGTCYPDPPPEVTDERTRADARRYSACPESSDNRSLAPQYTVRWDASASRVPPWLTAFLAPDRQSRDLSRFRSLQLRAAVVRDDPRNDPGDGTPGSATQDFTVSLVDADGMRSSVKAARFTTSLEPTIGDHPRHVVLNGIRIPMARFAKRDIDLTRIQRVVITFNRRESGSLQLSDLSFQEGR